jgi:hypothetical protein
MSIEAMKQALEALEMLAKWEHPASNITTKTGRIYPHRVAVDAADTLRTAIEQAEKQGPVAWGMPRSDGLILDIIAPEEHESYEGEYTIPLYTTPPTYEQGWKDGYKHGAWANTAAPVQERNFCERCGKRLNDGRIHTCTPPETQRQWIGLTEEEHTQIAVDAGCMSSDWVFYGAAVERALKEKNK